MPGCSFHLLSPCLVDLMLGFTFVSLISSKFNCISSFHVPNMSLFERQGGGEKCIFTFPHIECMSCWLLLWQIQCVVLFYFYRECEGCTFSWIKQTTVTKVFCWEIRCVPSNLHIPFCTAFASEYVFALMAWLNGPRVSRWFFEPCVSWAVLH